MLRKGLIDQWISLSNRENGKLIKLNKNYVKVMGYTPALTFTGNYDDSKVYTTGDIIIDDDGKYHVMYDNRFVEIIDTQIAVDLSGSSLSTYDDMNKCELGILSDTAADVLKTYREN